MGISHEFPMQSSVFHGDFPGPSTSPLARSARFGGDYRDETPRDGDGTPLVAITAMDALDFRGEDRRWDPRCHDISYSIMLAVI